MKSAVKACLIVLLAVVMISGFYSHDNKHRAPAAAAPAHQQIEGAVYAQHFEQLDGASSEQPYDSAWVELATSCSEPEPTIERYVDNAMSVYQQNVGPISAIALLDGIADDTVRSNGSCLDAASIFVTDAEPSIG